MSGFQDSPEFIFNITQKTMVELSGHTHLSLNFIQLGINILIQIELW